MKTNWKVDREVKRNFTPHVRSHGTRRDERGQDQPKKGLKRRAGEGTSYREATSNSRNESKRLSTDGSVEEPSRSEPRVSHLGSRKVLALDSEHTVSHMRHTCDTSCNEQTLG
jgi:hypothetical protein